MMRMRPRWPTVVVLPVVLACGETAVVSPHAALFLQVVAPQGAVLMTDQVRIRLDGPTPGQRTAAPGETVTFDSVEPGSYRVEVEGRVGSDVEWYDEIGVSVSAGQTRTIQVTARSFIPADLRIDTGIVEGGNAVTLEWDSVSFATEYVVEQADNAAFSGSTEHPPVQGTSLTSTLARTDRGTFHFRVRAVNRDLARSLPGPAGTVEVVEPPPLFCPSGPPGLDVFSDMQLAIQSVPEGGVLEVCDGMHQVEGAVIDHPMTIRADQGAQPVLRTEAERYTFLVDRYESGVVVLDGLTFDFSTPYVEEVTYAIFASGSFEHLVVRNSSFAVDPSSRGSIAINGAIPGATVTIEGTEISGGQWGVAAVSADLRITETKIQGTSIRAVNFFGASGRLEGGSQLLDCGIVACLSAYSGSEVTIVDSEFYGDESGDQHETRAVLRIDDSQVRVENNLFSGCGSGQCVTGFDGAQIDLLTNRFDVPDDQGTQWVVLAMNPGTRVHASGNDIRGIDADENPDTDATVWAAFGVNDGAILTAHDNTIRNTEGGFDAFQALALPGFIEEASRNVMEQVRVGFRIQGVGSQIKARFNDISGAATHIRVVDGPPALLDLTCNWWGSAAGPSVIDGSPATESYTPWASEPIAGTDSTGCSGGES